MWDLTVGIVALAVAVVWIFTGMMLVAMSESRGWVADALFVLTWPLNALADYFGWWRG